MPKLPKYVQGLIVVILAAIVGLILVQLIGNNEDEGFLSLVEIEEERVVPVTPEPSDGSEADITIEVDATPDATPESTPEVAATLEVTPESTPEVAATSDATPESTPEVDATLEVTPESTPESDVIPETPVGPTGTTSLGTRTVTESFPSPLGADVNMVFQWMMALGLLFGASFAVRKDFTSHRNVMTFLILVNWFSIFGRMVDTFGNVDTLAASEIAIYIHAIGGSIVMTFASYLAVRMWFENMLPAWIKINPIKFWMRLTLTCWLALIALGTFMYFDIYG